jgi:hypothetical protein
MITSVDRTRRHPELHLVITWASLSFKQRLPMIQTVYFPPQPGKFGATGTGHDQVSR